MKRQISLLACLLMLVAMVFAMASCVQPEANHVHNYVSSVTKEATCTENGELTYTCECGDTYTDEVQAKGHTPGVLAAVEPTCSTEGKTEGYGCTTCGTATTPQSVIAPLGHELGAPATCTTAQVCARGCGKVFVEALGHKGNEATCTEASVCYACNIELAEALGHKGNEATCTEASICYACETELEPALGHCLEYGMECCSAWCFRCGMEWVEATKEHEYMYACDTNCKNCCEFTRWEATHTMVFVEYKAPTCTELGNIEHWTCTDCNGCWDNENAMGFPLNQMMVKLWMVDHEYRYACDAHCMNCGNLTNEEAAHTLNHVDAVAPTCTENGNVEYWTCSDCGGCWDNDQATGMPLNRFMVVVPATGHAYFYECDAHCMNCYELTNEDAAHSLKHVAAVAPTCTENGNIEYWQCEFCGTAWDNANGTGVNLNRFMVIVNATGHEYAVECDPVCIRCYEIANPDAEHDVVHVAAKAPNCTTDGAVEHWYCSYCDLRWIDEDCTTTTSKQSVVIPNLGGHEGYDYDRKCDKCNLYILPEEGEAFKLGLVQKNLNKTLYFAGSLSGYYYATIQNKYAAPDMFIEETNGGFYIYFMEGTTKQYLSVQASGTYNNPKIGTTKGLFTFDEKTGAFITKTSNGNVYLGTYNSYDTISASYTSYITGGNAANVDKTQFVLRPEILVPHDCDSSAATCTEPGSACSICGIAPNALGHTVEEGLCDRCGETVVKDNSLKNATIKFNTTANRVSQTTSKQVWAQNGITVTNNKAASSSNVANYSNPARFYASSELIVEGEGIKTIVFDCNSSSYATALKNSLSSISGITVSVSSDKVTVTLSTATNSFKIPKLSAQVRMDAITVNP